MSDTIDLTELRDKSVDDIVAQLGTLTLDQLGELQAAEKADKKPRSTLLEPLQGEIDARLAMTGDTGGDDGEDETKPSSDQPMVILGVIAGIVGVLRPDYEVALPSADADLVKHAHTLSDVAIEAIKYLEQERNEACAEIEAMIADDERDDEDDEDAAIFTRHVAPDKKDIAFDNQPVTVAFASTGGQLIDALPALSFKPESFKRRKGDFLLMEPIKLPALERRVSIGAVWAFDADGEPVGRCKLQSPLGIGGAVEGALDAGTLRFTAD